MQDEEIVYGRSVVILFLDNNFGKGCVLHPIKLLIKAMTILVCLSCSASDPQNPDQSLLAKFEVEVTSSPQTHSEAIILKGVGPFRVSYGIQDQHISRDMRGEIIVKTTKNEIISLGKFKDPEIETAAVMSTLRIKKNAFPRPVPVVITLKDYRIPSLKNGETNQLIIYVDNMSSVWVDF